MGLHNQYAARDRGAVLGLAVALVMVLVLIALGLFALSMFFGAEREVQTASDAGALNVGNKAVTLSVPLLAGEETNQFADVLKGSPVSLSNINLCWAKAWLIALNADQMQKANQLGSGGIHATQVHDDAEAISARLCQVLKNGDNLSQFFSDYANLNPVRMLGGGNTVQVPSTADWSQSYLDTNYEGNVWIINAQIPIYSIIAQPPVPTVTPKNDPNQNTYLMGYTPYKVMNLNYWQVPFRFGERTHLVAKSQFAQSQASIPNMWSNALPNAFSTTGATSTDRQSRLLAASWVQGNAQKTYPAEMPAEYVKVHFHMNVLNWVVNGVQVKSDTYVWPYFLPGEPTVCDQKDFGPFDVPCGTVSAHEVLDQEFLPNGTVEPTTAQVMFALPPIGQNNSLIWKDLTQRMNQTSPVWPPHTMDWFNNFPFDGFAGKPMPDGDQEFVFSVAFYGNSMKTPCPDPDGTPILLESEPLQTSPNYGTVTLNCAGKPPVTYPTITMEEGERWWTPGSGYTTALTSGVWGLPVGGCLGRVDIYRTTTVYIFAF